MGALRPLVALAVLVAMALQATALGVVAAPGAGSAVASGALPGVSAGPLTPGGRALDPPSPRAAGQFSIRGSFR